VIFSEPLRPSAPRRCFLAPTHVRPRFASRLTVCMQKPREMYRHPRERVSLTVSVFVSFSLSGGQAVCLCSQFLTPSRCPTQNSACVAVTLSPEQNRSPSPFLSKNVTSRVSCMPGLLEGHTRSKPWFAPVLREWVAFRAPERLPKIGLRSCALYRSCTSCNIVT
jgi:hypothetical protein